MYKILIISVISLCFSVESSKSDTTITFQLEEGISEDVLMNSKLISIGFKNSRAVEEELINILDTLIDSIHYGIEKKLLSILNPNKYLINIDLDIIHSTSKIKKNIDLGLVEDIVFSDIIFDSDLGGSLVVEVYSKISKKYFELEIKPKVDIYIDESIDVKEINTTLINLVNSILNDYIIENVQDKPIKFEEYKDRINLIFVDISEFKQKESNTISLKRDDIYDDSWAVIIGIDKYQYSDPLHYAVKDAEAVRDMLINKFDYPIENIRYLTDEEATLSNIKLNLGEVATSAGENDRILVFYSGHGETLEGADGSKKGYIIPYEGKQDNPFGTGFSMSEIATTAQMSKAKHMLFLMDACYSGLMKENVKGLSKSQEKGYLSKIANEKARQIITAGGGDEQVIERDEWQHSAFTKNLIEGLDTWEADSNEDGYITADELSGYLRENVTEDSDFQQTPQEGRFEKSGGGEFVFFGKGSSVDNLNKTDLTNTQTDLIFNQQEMEYKQNWKSIRHSEGHFFNILNLSGNQHGAGFGFRRNFDRFLNNGKNAISYGFELYLQDFHNESSDNHNYLFNISPLISIKNYFNSYSDLYMSYGLGLILYEFQSDKPIIGYSFKISLGKLGMRLRDRKIFKKLNEIFPTMGQQLTIGYRYIPNSTNTDIYSGIELKLSAGYYNRNYSKGNIILPE